MDDCTYFVIYTNEHGVEQKTPYFFDREVALKVAEDWANNGTVRNVGFVTIKPIGVQE